MYSSGAQKAGDLRFDIYALQYEPNAKFRTVEEDGSLAINVHGVYCLLVPAERVMDEADIAATHNMSLLTNNPKSKKAAAAARTIKYEALQAVARRMKTGCGPEQIVQIEYNGKKYALLHEQAAKKILRIEAPEEKIEVKPETSPVLTVIADAPDSAPTGAQTEEIENPAVSENKENEPPKEASTTGAEAQPSILKIIDVDLKPASIQAGLNRELLEEIKNSSKAWVFKNRGQSSERFFVSYPLIAHELKERGIKPVVISPVDLKARSADFWDQKPDEIYVLYSRSTRNLCAAFVNPELLKDLQKSHLRPQPETPASAQEETVEPAGNEIGDQFESAATLAEKEQEQPEPQTPDPQETHLSQAVDMPAGKQPEHETPDAQEAFSQAAATAAQTGDVGQALSVLMETFSRVGQTGSPKAISIKVEIVNRDGAVDTLTFTRNTPLARPQNG